MIPALFLINQTTKACVSEDAAYSWFFLFKKEECYEIQLYSDYKVKRPGRHIFAMTPKPYWEPAEDGFIIFENWKGKAGR
ncbi:MAG: hypothetical protein ACLFNW_12435 [Desulfobacterales bacterium]